MLRLTSFIIIFFASVASAALPNIVALVNNEPITLYEYQARKKMIMVLNKIHNPDAKTEKQINKIALNTLIDEQVLFQHARNVGSTISEEEVNNAINTIEQRNGMQKGYLLNFLKSNSVDVNSFKSQIRAELIKMNILSYLSRSVTVSPKEIDAIILSSDSKDAKISAAVFTSNDKGEKTLRKMYNFQKHIKSCEKLKEADYKSFATAITIEDNLSQLDKQLQIIIKDLSPNKASSVFETSEGFKMVLVCKKEINNFTDEENNYVVNFLTNKKMSQKALKFYDALSKKAYIKVMLPE